LRRDSGPFATALLVESRLNAPSISRARISRNNRAPLARIRDRTGPEQPPIAGEPFESRPTLRIRGLIFARAILEQRGATEVELEEHRLEIERLRWRLASLMRGGPADSDTAA
jgi:hypothetical protein